jgi:hypothetical protein
MNKIVTLSRYAVNRLQDGGGECVVKHSPDYVRRRFAAGKENALLLWVFPTPHKVLLIPQAALIIVLFRV